MTSRRAAGVVAAATLLAACSRPPVDDAGPRRVLLPTAGGERAIEVEVAATPEERARGLMYRTDLLEDSGMLFVFDRPADHAFWMQNTPLPLDLVFVAPDGRIVGLIEGARPYDETPLRVGKPSLYVVEVRGGWARRAGLDTGGRVRFE